MIADYKLKIIIIIIMQYLYFYLLFKLLFSERKKTNALVYSNNNYNGDKNEK